MNSERSSGAISRPSIHQGGLAERLLLVVTGERSRSPKMSRADDGSHHTGRPQFSLPFEKPISELP